MIDVNSLGLVEPDQLDWDNYEEGGQSKPLPPKGRYKLTAPQFEEKNFTKGSKNQLVVKFDATIAEGPHKGTLVRFLQASTTKYSNREGSGLGDYLKAFGIKAKPTTNAEYVNLVAQTGGRTFEADLDWEAYDKVGPVSKKGMSEFPPKGDGTFQGWIDHPTAVEPDPLTAGKNRPKRVWANLRVKNYVTKKA